MLSTGKNRLKNYIKNLEYKECFKNTYHNNSRRPHGNAITVHVNQITQGCGSVVMERIGQTVTHT